MALDDLQHRLAIRGVTVVRAHRPCYTRRLQVCLTGHQRRHRSGVAAALVRVIRHPERHQRRAEIRVAESQFTIRVRVLRDFVGRIRGIVDRDFLRRDHHVDRVAERVGVEVTLLVEEAQQVKRSEVACRDIEMHVLAARIRGVDAAARRARVPRVDGRVELHPGIAARPRCLRDHAHQFARAILFRYFMVLDEMCLPGRVVDHGVHELVGHAHGVVGVLEKDGTIGGAIERGVIAGVDQRPRLLLLILLARDEFFDVGMVGVEHDHLGCAPGLAARLDHAGRRVRRLHERKRAGRGAARRKFLEARTQRRKIHARTGTAFEDHSFVAVPAQDRLHVVVDLENETGRALRFGLDADVEPYRAVERRHLVDEQMRQFGLERVALGVGGEIMLALAPSGDRVDYAADELADTSLALGASERAAEVLRNDDVGRGLRPPARHLDIALLEDYMAVLAGDKGRARLPFDLRERVDTGLGEITLETDTSTLRGAFRLMSFRLFYALRHSFTLPHHSNPSNYRYGSPLRTTPRILTPVRFSNYYCVMHLSSADTQQV